MAEDTIRATPGYGPDGRVCLYSGYEFGAGYPDSTCIDGYLWDLDSFENGEVTSGGDIPCIACNTGEWLDYAMDEAAGFVTHSGVTSLEYANRAIRTALKRHPALAISHLGSCPSFTVFEPLCPRDPHAGEREISWPWNVPDITAHQMTRIRALRGRMAQAAPAPAPDRGATDV